eukprot:133255_1
MNLILESLLGMLMVVRCLILANLKRIVKWSWDALIKEIRRNLERETNHSELVTVEENICYDAIRFEKGVRIKGNEETLFEAQPNVGNYAKVIKEEVEMTIKATLVESQKFFFIHRYKNILITNRMT